jgi:hypothetical protein
MNNISVIIPTLWKPIGLEERLIELSKIDSVEEIILIDNTPSPPDLTIPKLNHIKEYRNTYVNPAWNKGFRLSKSNKLCFMNDDVDFDFDLFKNISPHITEDKGMIGLYEYHGNGVWEDEPGCDRSRPDYRRGNRGMELKVLEVNGGRRPGFGCLWFIHKKSYTTIPEEIKIWYGDDWIYHKSGKPNYSIINLDIIGKPSQTSDLIEFNEVKSKDQGLYHKYF